MTDRLRYLDEFDFSHPQADSAAIFGALVACLHSAEACQALDPRCEQAYPKRRALIRKIQSDMRRELLPCHQELLATLERGIDVLPGPKRSSAAGTLLRLAEALPADQEHEILERLSRARNATIRRQVYRRLKELDPAECPPYTVAALQTFGDLEAARLLVLRAAVEVLRDKFDLLEAALGTTGYLLSRLFLRLSGRYPADLARLKALDPVSHAYVCVKLGVNVPETELIALYRDTMFSERSGLVVWCCGQLGYWNGVVEMQRLADDPPEGVRQDLAARYAWWPA